jgi:uncharacterized protein YbjT (DUF2867 family)
MKIVLFGATGMIGQGVLRECLLSTDVESVLAIGRSTTGGSREKLREITCSDFTDYGPLEADLAGLDACFFCLGASSAGMNEADYLHLTHDVTLAAASTLVRLNPGMTFVYVSGAGTDSSEQGRSMWARVKGKTENALLALPFKAVYMFRPGLIQPLHGITSRTRLYRIVYTMLGPLFPVLRPLFPRAVTTTEAIGRAMIRVAKLAAPKPILESADINLLAASRP